MYKVKALEIFMTIILWQCGNCKLSYQAFLLQFLNIVVPNYFLQILHNVPVLDHMFANFANYCFQVLITNLANCHYGFFLQMVQIFVIWVFFAFFSVKFWCKIEFGKSSFWIIFLKIVVLEFVLQIVVLDYFLCLASLANYIFWQIFQIVVADNVF